MYEEDYNPIMNFLFVPFFFASIGFSIPITDMFKGSIVWRGIVYSILMIFAKGLVSLVIYSEYFIKSWNKSKEIRKKPYDMSTINIPSSGNYTSSTYEDFPGRICNDCQRINLILDRVSLTKFGHSIVEKSA
ncbi:hypothetical protein EYC84_004340 [Monilinia fructicola]|uniref:Cation/H+ exchanger transmembrane domain-containing protein n=1 Tax=Monilinia fructicola TaxID=38448 RepID=A0A5M9K525_MONFR|nr:hypothetical protein EYC84_004340 [Monilinia fructicola]